MNPIILEISDAVKLRWYGFAYLMAFVVGYFILKWLGDRKMWVLPGNVAGDFIAYVAIFGVFLGGRIGNVLIYQRDEFMENPVMLFKVWEGGMASHGGIVGVMLFTFVYSRMKKVSWTGLGDGVSVVAPLGIMFGRLANFVNGELYGRVDKGFAWAMKFPNAIWDSGTVEGTKPNLTMAAAARADKGGEFTQFYDRLIEGSDAFYDGKLVKGTQEYKDYIDMLGERPVMLNKAVRENPDVKEAVAHFLEPRYPSQLFQAALEGLLLFVILLVIRLRFPKAANGVLTGFFFIFYAIFRISMERYREPEIANIEAFGSEWTMGQFLSLFMVFIGVGFLVKAQLSVKKGNLFNCGHLSR